MNPTPDHAAATASPAVLTFAAVTWDFALVGRSRMLSEAWARIGPPPVFVQTPSLRTAWERVRNGGVQQATATVVRPWPLWPSRTWRWRSRRAIEAQAARQARRLRRTLDPHVDWDRSAALVVSPVWAPWLRELPLRTVVYDCIDDLSVQIPGPHLLDWFRCWEDDLLAQVDGAAASACVLRDDLARRRPDLPIEVIRNGVDAERFAATGDAAPRPADMPARGRPIVGFVGALYSWIDWELIAAAARRLPEVEFVLVGPHDGRGEPERLAGLANVHLLGPRPYALAPAYMAAFDVCWIPFRQDRIAAAANPVKTYEYLALGKPVVSTPVADPDSFEGLVAFARTEDDVVAALDDALRNPPTDAAARRGFARRNSWEARARQYLALFERLAR